MLPCSSSSGEIGHTECKYTLRKVSNSLPSVKFSMKPLLLPYSFFLNKKKKLQQAGPMIMPLLDPSCHTSSDAYFTTSTVWTDVPECRTSSELVHTRCFNFLLSSVIPEAFS